MSTLIEMRPSSDRELVMCRHLKAPREAVFRCWTDPLLIPKWFAPKPWGVSRAEMDVRAGGSSLVVMTSPEGQEFPNPGVYLEVIPGRKLVFTNAYVKAWEPSEKPFMTGILTFEDFEGGTRYTARTLHWTVADREAHEKMGFHAGWGKCADQLEEIAVNLWL